MISQYETILQAGERIRAHRIAKGLSPEEVAAKTGLSRSAIYRYEAGQPIRVDALGKIADLLGISLASLFGVGSEFISSALVFYDRMHQLESNADQISVLFGPISFLLTTEHFDSCLRDALSESVPHAAANRSNFDSQLDQIIEILLARKETYRKRRPSIVSLVSAAELEQFLSLGIVGKQGLEGEELARRKNSALMEVENILKMLVDQPMGVQIGIVEDSLPGASFQIFRSGKLAQVATSSFRLGLYANVRVGVATITAAQDSVELHQEVTEDLWRNSWKGNDAINAVKEILQRHK